MGHPSMDVLCKAKDHTKGFPNNIIYPEETPMCLGCAQGKMPSASFPLSQSCTSRPYEKVHSDVKSFPVASYHKAQYFVSFLDNYTSHATVVLINKKSSIIVTLKQFLSYIETQFNVTVKEWMSDTGGEYKSEAFDVVLHNKGIRILQSIPHTPQQNGCAECFNCTLMDKAQSMQLEACFPQSWWEFAVEHAVHLYNRTPVQCLNWQMLLNGYKCPAISTRKAKCPRSRSALVSSLLISTHD
jgi:Integrase core domain